MTRVIVWPQPRTFHLHEIITDELRMSRLVKKACVGKQFSARWTRKIATNLAAYLCNPSQGDSHPVRTISTHTAITRPHIEVEDIPTLLLKMLVLPSVPSCGTAVTTVTFTCLCVTDVYSYVADVTRGCGYGDSVSRTVSE